MLTADGTPALSERAAVGTSVPNEFTAIHLVILLKDNGDSRALAW